ncbi:twin-arginine translocation signal domain-containing protein [Streptomyces sp. NPDC088725]|uniref:twin-arginine translocation signal domain-containing protein n=1 Tax=Streptomyces sp. NPDC088725 TaxID=3365873 RepID=UPI0037FB5FD6
MKLTGLSRRRFIGASSGVAAAAALVNLGGADYASADTGTGTWNGATSENGWPVLDAPTAFTIEGSGQKVPLAGGDAATVLLHVARRFHYEMDSLRAGDVLGWTGDRKVTAPYESNYLSGTAIAIRPAWYPVGSKGNLYPGELVVVRDILTELDGVVAWGGDFATPKESHFEIALKDGHPRLKGVARKIRGWDAGPGDDGAGSIDAFDPRRRSAAQAFERRLA